MCSKRMARPNGPRVRAGRRKDPAGGWIQWPSSSGAQCSLRPIGARADGDGTGPSGGSEGTVLRATTRSLRLEDQHKGGQCPSPNRRSHACSSKRQATSKHQRQAASKLQRQSRVPEWPISYSGNLLRNIRNIPECTPEIPEIFLLPLDPRVPWGCQH